MKVFGLTFPEWLALITILSIIFGSLASLIRYFSKAITKPLTKAVEELTKDLKNYRKQHEKNENKLFSMTDDHTKQLINHEGRLNSLEVNSKSNTLRIDRLESKG